MSSGSNGREDKSIYLSYEHNHGNSADSKYGYLRRIQYTLLLCFIIVVFYVGKLLVRPHISFDTWLWFFTAYKLNPPNFGILISPLLHTTSGHLFVNILGLVVFGWIVESRLSRRWFFALVVISGLGLNIGELVYMGGETYVLGSSGMVRGLMGFGFLSLVSEYLNSKQMVEDSCVPYTYTFSMYTIGSIVVLSIVKDSFVTHSVTGPGRVASVGHLTALFIGVVLFLLYWFINSPVRRSDESRLFS